MRTLKTGQKVLINELGKSGTLVAVMPNIGQTKKYVKEIEVMLQKCFVLLFALLFSAGGCGTIDLDLTQPDEIPPGCENSLILKYVPAPKVIDVGLKIAVVQVAKLGYKEEVKTAITDVLWMLPETKDDNLKTGAEFVSYIMTRVNFLNKYAGVELVIVSETLNVIDVNIPLDWCDIEIIRKHLEGQLLYVNMVPDEASWRDEPWKVLS